MQRLIKDYLKCLETSDYANLMTLFANGATIDSPLYGRLYAKDFYAKLFADTSESKIKLQTIFTNREKKSAAAHFEFDWTLKDGTPAPFEVVDIFQFNHDCSKISHLKIIYDTAQTRTQFDRAMKP